MRFIDDAAGLGPACRALEQQPFVYLDTEFDAGRDGTRLCLVQLSAGNEVFLIDALKISELAPLGRALGERGQTWVVHAGQQDIALLTARIGVSPPRVFDTQVAWALLSIEHSTSLSYLKYQLLGLRGEKSHQADDWRRRPLPETQLAYAAEDVLHLPALHRALTDRTARLGRLEAVYQASSEAVLPASEPPAPLRLDTFRNAWQLELEGQAVLGFLIEWYNALDERERQAAPDVKGLFSIASRRPKNLEELSGLRAVPKRAVANFGKGLVTGIQRAVARAHSAEFIALDPPPYATPADLLAAGWLEAIRAEICVELNVAPELAMPARLMRRMRDAAVSAGKLRGAMDLLAGWRQPLLAAELASKIERYGTLERPSVA